MSETACRTLGPNRRHTLRRAVIGAASAALCVMTACAPGADEVASGDEGDQGRGPDGDIAQEVSSAHAHGDWSDFPNGMECGAAVDVFFPRKFGVATPHMGGHTVNGCYSDGACQMWEDAGTSYEAHWERIANDGKHLPSTYDLIIYPPHQSAGYYNHWGHAAVVDHVEGKTIYVMDDNYVGHLEKAPYPHTVSTKAYGWYHLKKLGSGPSGGGTSGGTSGGGGACVAGGYYCGGDKVSGDPDTLYRCENGKGEKVESCADGCVVRSGKDDTCRTCVTGGYYCGGDKLAGDHDTLYRCDGDSHGDVVKHCANGCAVAPAGEDDRCR